MNSLLEMITKTTNELPEPFRSGMPTAVIIGTFIIIAAFVITIVRIVSRATTRASSNDTSFAENETNDDYADAEYETYDEYEAYNEKQARIRLSK